MRVKNIGSKKNNMSRFKTFLTNLIRLKALALITSKNKVGKFYLIFL